VAKRLADALKGKKISIVPMSDNGTLSMIDINRFLENMAAAKVIKKTDTTKPEVTAQPEKETVTPAEEKKK